MAEKMIDLINEYIEELESSANNTRFKRLLLISGRIFGDCHVKFTPYFLRRRGQETLVLSYSREKVGRPKAIRLVKCCRLLKNAAINLAKYQWGHSPYHSYAEVQYGSGKRLLLMG